MSKYSGMSIDTLYKMYDSSDIKSKPILKKLIECKKKLICLDNEYKINMDKLNMHNSGGKIPSKISDENSEQSDTIFGSLIGADDDYDIENRFTQDTKNDYQNTYSSNKLMERMECDKHIYADKKKSSILRKPYISLSDDIDNL